LKGIIEHEIIFNRGNGFAIFGFIDLDCARDQHGCWSTFGHVFQLDNTCTMWSSWRLPMIAFSSIEAKCKSLAKGTKSIHIITKYYRTAQVTYYTFFDTFLWQYKHNIKIVKNLMMYVRTKHRELHSHFITLVLQCMM
jgi:hypothetical protein